MIRLPSYISAKCEIITAYGCRGFRSFDDEEKVSPKVFEDAMRVRNEYGWFYLDMYSCYPTSNDVIEVCMPLRDYEFGFLDVSQNLTVKKNESSLWFWFRKKFPRICLMCFVQSDKYLGNIIFIFKLKVLINGTEQFTSQCKYIFHTERVTVQGFMCDVHCKVGGVFSGNEWNKVEILCELKTLTPCDLERVMTYQIGTTTSTATWDFKLENIGHDLSYIDNPDSPMSTEIRLNIDSPLIG
ncbi:hypothetical protein RYX36_017176 [Vicia faba]